MDPNPLYSPELIDELCDDVKRCWNYHLLVRAVFHAGVRRESRHWRSPGFYKNLHAINFDVRILNDLPNEIAELLPNIGQWLNQNFVIRLYGILDEHGVITMGKQERNVYTKILAKLRHKIGTHSRGYKNPSKSDDEKLAKLVAETFNTTLGPNELKHFHLPIDKVLRPLKDQCIEFVRVLDGKPKPERKPQSTSKE